MEKSEKMSIIMKKMFPEAKICIDSSCAGAWNDEKLPDECWFTRNKAKAAVKVITLQTGQLCKAKPDMCKAIYFTWFFRQKTAVNFQFSVHFPGWFFSLARLILKFRIRLWNSAFFTLFNNRSKKMNKRGAKMYMQS